MATAADCYKFSCETGVIRADELFLGVEGGQGISREEGDAESSGDGGGSQKKNIRAAGKKRKAASGAQESDSPDSAVGDVGTSEESGTVSAATSPRVLRSLASIVERFGNFLNDFPFQSLAGGEGDFQTKTGVTNADGDVQRVNSQSTRAALQSASLNLATPRPLVVDDPGLLPTERAAARLSRAVLLRRGLTLLALCLSESEQKGKMAALLVREGLWNRNMHLVIIYALSWPWAGGLLPRASDGEEVEQCELDFT